MQRLDSITDRCYQAGVKEGSELNERRGLEATEIIFQQWKAAYPPYFLEGEDFGGGGAGSRHRCP